MYMDCQDQSGNKQEILWRRYIRKGWWFPFSMMEKQRKPKPHRVNDELCWIIIVLTLMQSNSALCISSVGKKTEDMRGSVRIGHTSKLQQKKNDTMKKSQHDSKR